uniref:(northern house mosquito) hypothetical protein n=1 Tax=Culex pipiens TaxID=7175 RepID=A0A8D8IZS4_CULPI
MLWPNSVEFLVLQSGVSEILPSGRKRLKSDGCGWKRQDSGSFRWGNQESRRGEYICGWIVLIFSLFGLREVNFDLPVGIQGNYRQRPVKNKVPVPPDRISKITGWCLILWSYSIVYLVLRSGEANFYLPAANSSSAPGKKTRFQFPRPDIQKSRAAS